MTSPNEQNKLTPTQELEEQMAVIICAWCENKRNIVHNPGMTDTHTNKDVIRGVLTCGNPSCRRKTLFEMTGNDPSFLPGKLFQEDLRQNVDKDARTMFEDACLCMYGSSYRGVVAMCRSAVEAELEVKNVHGKKRDELYDKIETAKEGGLLDEVHYTEAHSARITGRDVLHRIGNVSLSQAILALTATADVLNYLAPKPPLPAS